MHEQVQVAGARRPGYEDIIEVAQGLFEAHGRAQHSVPEGQQVDRHGFLLGALAEHGQARGDGLCKAASAAVGRGLLLGREEVTEVPGKEDGRDRLQKARVAAELGGDLRQERQGERHHLLTRVEERAQQLELGEHVAAAEGAEALNEAHEGRLVLPKGLGLLQREEDGAERLLELENAKLRDFQHRDHVRVEAAHGERSMEVGAPRLGRVHQTQPLGQRLGAEPQLLQGV